MVMLGMLALLPLPLIAPSAGLPFFAGSLVFMLLYLWSRENPNANTSIMGMIKMKAFYLPWGMMALEALMGGSVVPDLLGVVVGHLYYFLTVLQPQSGRVAADRDARFRENHVRLAVRGVHTGEWRC
jgi:Derlin-2/3